MAKARNCLAVMTCQEELKGRSSVLRSVKGRTRVITRPEQRYITRRTSVVAIARYTVGLNYNIYH